MEVLKFVFHNNSLIMEIKRNETKEYFHEDFIPARMEEICKFYLGKFYEQEQSKIGREFLNNLKKLDMYPERVITVTKDRQWEKSRNSLEYIRIIYDYKNSESKTNFSDSEQEPDSEKITNILPSFVLDDLKDAARKNPEDPDIHYKLGLAFYQRKEFDDAIDEFREAISIDQGNPDYFLKLADSYSETSRFDLAISEYQECLKFNENDPKIHLEIGNCYLKNNKAYEAINYYQNCILLDPLLIEIYLRLGEAFNQVNLFEDAIFILEEGLRVEPENQEIPRLLKVAEQNKIKADATDLNNLGIGYAEKGKFDKAIEKFLLALKVFPEDTEILFNLALAYFKNEEFQKAEEIFNKILIIDKQLSEALEYLEKIKTIREKADKV